MNKVTKTLLKVVPVGLLAFFPVLASAQIFDDGGDFESATGAVQSLVNALIPLVAAIALLAFFWGLAKYVFQSDDEEAQDQGKRIMIGGIVALFLIAAVGGIVEFLSDALGFDTDATIDTTNIDTSEN